MITEDDPDEPGSAQCPQVVVDCRLGQVEPFGEALEIGLSEPELGE